MKKKISYVGIGDVGIDVYPELGKQFPGGMALNSVFHAQKAGLEASVVSAIGDDQEGVFLGNFLKKTSINSETIEIIHGRTDTVEITLDANARPQYGIWNLGVLENYQLTKRQKQYLRTQDVVITVYLPELRLMFDDVAGAHLPHTIKVGDFTDLSEYQGEQDILKEYVDKFNIFILSIDEKVDERLENFTFYIQKNKKMGIALLGPKGSVCIDNIGKKYFIPANDVRVIDTTGAGDAYTATFIGEYMQHKNIKIAMTKATKRSSKIIQHYGVIENFFIEL